ncbi:peptidoglycan-binding protein [Streptomyces griseoluteus]|uniref:peptidoglycan-binding domain-containing protein n=1 Tax=Streptomyces griseoluteus TaxID=29306 RepID=UPI00368360D9
MRKVKAALAAATTFAAGMIALVPASTATAATPTCNSAGTYAGAWVPIYRATPSVNCNLVQGTNSVGVRQLQTTLNKCYRAGLVEDGDFGPATRNALINAQRAAGTPADGEYGPNTRKAIKHEPVDGSTNCVRVP